LTDEVIDSTTLFRNTIVNTGTNPATKTVFQNKLNEVAELIVAEQENEKTDETKVELGLGATQDISFSEEQSEALTDKLSFTNKTTPNKIGDLVITSNLEQVTTTSEFTVFVTPYNSILDVPKYAQVRDQGFTLLAGFDVVLKDSSGKRQLNVVDASIVQEVLSASSFGSLNETAISYLSFDGSNWTEVGTNLTVASNQVSGLENILKLSPYALARKNFLQDPVNFPLTGYSTLKNPVVIAKGHYEGSEIALGSIFSTLGTSSAVNLDAETLSAASVTFRIPQDYVIDELVLLSKDISKFTTGDKVSIEIKVEEGAASSEKSLPVEFIEDDTLKSLLISGSGLESFAGLAAFIETRIPYEILGLSFENYSAHQLAGTAHQAILDNTESFLNGNGNGTFSTSISSALTWARLPGDGSASLYTFEANEPANSFNLREENKDSDGLLVYTRTISWRYFEAKVEKRVSLSHTSGPKSGGGNSQVITFSRNDQTILAAVFQDSRTNLFQSSSGYRSLNYGVYLGSAIFERDSNYLVTSILSAKFEQNTTEVLTFNGALLGGVNSLRGFTTLDNAKLDFEGDFNFYLQSYGTVTGSVVLKANSIYARGFDNGYYNNNLVEDALFTVQSLPEKQTITLPDSIDGQWSGALTDSCGDDGLMILQISNSNQSWTAQSADSSRVYGTRTVISDTSVFFYDINFLWSLGTFDPDAGQITGNWHDGTCNGSYTLTK